MSISDIEWVGSADILSREFHARCAIYPPGKDLDLRAEHPVVGWKVRRDHHYPPNSIFLLGPHYEKFPSTYWSLVRIDITPTSTCIGASWLCRPESTMRNILRVQTDIGRDRLLTPGALLVLYFAGLRAQREIDEREAEDEDEDEAQGN